MSENGRFKSYLATASLAGQKRPPRAHPAIGLRSWREREKTGRMIELRQEYRCGHKDIPAGSKEGKANSFHEPEGSSPEGVRTSVQDTIGVEEQSMSSQG